MKSTLCIFILFLLSSCQWISEFGPVDLSKIEKEQTKGNYQPDLVVIEINSKNLDQYNKHIYKNTHGKVPPSDPNKHYSDKITTYDKLNLLVLDSAQNQAAMGNGTTAFGPIEVPEDGIVSFPYAGEFAVIGMSIAELQSKIQNKYRDVFNTAEVTLVRTDRQNFTANVIGRVAMPKQHQLIRKNIKIGDLIANSGGVNIEPHLCEYKLHRGHKTYKLTHHLIHNSHVYAQHGDVIEVEKKVGEQVTIMGAVTRPGNQTLEDTAVPLTQLLGKASGMQLQTSNAKGVFVIRKKRNDYSDVYKFNMQETQGLVMASKFNVIKDDLIYVTEAPLSKWGRVLRSILPLGNQTIQGTGRLDNLLSN